MYRTRSNVDDEVNVVRPRETENTLNVSKTMMNMGNNNDNAAGTGNGVSLRKKDRV